MYVFCLIGGAHPIHTHEPVTPDSDLVESPFCVTVLDANGEVQTSIAAADIPSDSILASNVNSAETFHSIPEVPSTCSISIMSNVQTEDYPQELRASNSGMRTDCVTSPMWSEIESAIDLPRAMADVSVLSENEMGDYIVPINTTSMSDIT